MLRIGFITVNSNRIAFQKRTFIRESSTIPAIPYALKNGHAKVSLTAIICLCIGGKLAQEAASFLEENEIFIHSIVDDD